MEHTDIVEHNIVYKQVSYKLHQQDKTKTIKKLILIDSNLTKNDVQQTLYIIYGNVLKCYKGSKTYLVFFVFCSFLFVSFIDLTFLLREDYNVYNNLDYLTGRIK